MQNMTIEDIVRAIFAVGFLLVFAYLTVTGRDMSSQQNNILLIIIAFYFPLNEIARYLGKYVDRKQANQIKKDTP